jgi:hypothetical protein
MRFAGLIITVLMAFGLGILSAEWLKSEHRVSVTTPLLVNTVGDDVKPEWFREVSVNGFVYMIYTGPGHLCPVSDVMETKASEVPVTKNTK